MICTIVPILFHSWKDSLIQPRKGKDNANREPSSSNFLDNASTTTCSLPLLYIISYSYPNILVTHLCLFSEGNLCLRKYFKLWWSILIWKHLPKIYWCHVSNEWRMVSISSWFVYFPEFWSHNYLLVIVEGDPSSVNTSPRYLLEESHFKIKILSKI